MGRIPFRAGSHPISSGTAPAAAGLATIRRSDEPADRGLDTAERTTEPAASGFDPEGAGYAVWEPKTLPEGEKWAVLRGGSLMAGVGCDDADESTAPARAVSQS